MSQTSCEAKLRKKSSPRSPAMEERAARGAQTTETLNSLRASLRGLAPDATQLLQIFDSHQGERRPACACATPRCCFTP